MGVFTNVYVIDIIVLAAATHKLCDIMVFINNIDIKYATEMVLYSYKLFNNSWGFFRFHKTIFLLVLVGAQRCISYKVFRGTVFSYIRPSRVFHNLCKCIDNGYSWASHM